MTLEKGNFQWPLLRSLFNREESRIFQSKARSASDVMLKITL